MTLQQQLYDKLLDQFASGSGDFLIYKTQDTWDWKRQANEIPSAAFSLAGFMPAPSDEGPFYMGGATNIYDAYKSTVNSVKLEVSDEHKQQMIALEEDINSTQVAKREEYMRYLQDYKDNGGGADEEDWKKMTGWDVKLTQYDKQMEALTKKKDDIIKESNADHNEAVEALDGKKGFVSMMRSGNFTKVPNYIIDKDAIEWRTKVSRGQGNKVSLNLSTGSNYTAKYKDKSFRANVSFFYYDVTSKSRESLNIEKEKTNINISFDAVTTVNVRPDPEWYHQSYLNKIGQLGKWIDDRTTAQVFGSPNGFHSVVTGFVVVYKPSIEVSISGSSYSKMKTAVNSKKGFGFGPFFFHGESSSSESSQCVTEERNGRLVIKSESKYGQIIGVLARSPDKM